MRQDIVNRRLSVAPMMRTTHRHFRWLMRRMSRRTLLYTEMMSSGSIIHGNGMGLSYDQSELPLALQVGGNDPAAMAACAEQAERRGFSEINVNAGCPSAKVRNANFGACLFSQPRLLADCVSAMRDAASIPVTVKTRIGVDDVDSQEALHELVDKVSAAGCGTFIVHARKALLSGLNPKQNRTVPPLCYERVFWLKRQFPHLEIILNGGIRDLRHGAELLPEVDGVMLGRAMVSDPWQLLQADQMYFNATATPTPRADVIADYMDYAITAHKEGAPPSKLLQPLLHTLRGFPGARAWRNTLASGGIAALTESRRQLPKLLPHGA